MSDETATIVDGVITLGSTEPAAVVEAPEIESAAPKEAADEEVETVEPEKRRKESAQERIDAITRRAREAERAADFWKTRAEAQTQPKGVAEQAQKPSRADYTDDSEWVEALTDWKTEQKLDARLKTFEAEQAKAQASTQRASTWEQRQAAAIESIPDLAEVIRDSDVPVPSHVIEAIQESEFGPQIAYHLAKHPDVAEKIGEMSQGAALRYLGRLEAQFDTPVADTSADTSVAKTTKAPPPARPAKQATSTEPDLGKMSMDDFIKAGRARGAIWAR